MSLNSVSSSNRIHISFFGKRNAGKSTLVNAVTNQNISVVSDVKGTTTDPVSKSMELLPLGPVVITDTPGFDDVGSLGQLRVETTRRVLRKTDIAVLVADVSVGITDTENELISLFAEHNIPYIIVYNKSDVANERHECKENEIYVSAKNKEGIHELKELIGSLCPKKINELFFVGDFLNKDDIVVFVTPIDEAAPRGRLILPQQQAIRDALDFNAISVVVQVPELKRTIDLLGDKIKLVVTDSQAFAEVSPIVPENIYLTSFSILMARIKGLLDSSVYGAAVISKLSEYDKILICEGCTHHRQCNDIGTVKLPKWLEKFTGKHFNYTFTSGGDFPEDLSGYRLVIHCGGCMLNDKEMLYRVNSANKQNIPITNYGIAIAYMNGILKRSLKVLKIYDDII